jgi:hypothetical protein
MPASEEFTTFRRKGLGLGRSLTPDVLVNPAVTYQTMIGWDFNSQMGYGNESDAQDGPWNIFKTALIDLVADDLGVNSLTITAQPCQEHTEDLFTRRRTGLITTQYFKDHANASINDNGNANSINSGGFIWAGLDFELDRVVVPMRAKLAALGETLHLKLTYTAFTNGNLLDIGDANVHTTAAEYAEFMEALFIHMDGSYGFVPDAIDLILEPDNSTLWAANAGTLIGNCAKEAGDRLATHNWHPIFIGPSVTNAGNAETYLTNMLAVSGASAYVTLGSYHRYAGTASIASFVTYAQGQGKQVGMSEWMPSDINTLWEDLGTYSNSIWQQLGCAYQFTTQAAIDAQDDVNAGNLFYILTLDPDVPVIQWGKRTPPFRQVFRYVRRGAVRVGVTSTNGAVSPLAFRNTNGRYAVCCKTTGSASWTVGGMPAGTYGVTYSAILGASTQTVLPSQTIAAGQPLAVSVPAAAVLTVFKQP